MDKTTSAISLPINPTASETPAIDPAAFYNAVWGMSEHSMYTLEVIRDGADFRFLAFNPACIDNSPIPTDHIKGRLLSEAFSPDVSELYQNHYSKCVRTQKAISFEEKLSIAARTTYWQITVYPLIAATGTVAQLFVRLINITQKQQATLALLESRQVLQQVIDTVPAAIFWKDCDSRYLGCNRAFANTAGEDDAAALVGKSDYDLIWKKEESDWFVDCDRRIMQTDQPEYDIVEPQLQAGGRQAWVRTSKIPLHDPRGKVNGILGIVEDITARKEAEDTRARLLAILEATPDVVSIIDAKGNHHYLNRAGQRLFGIETPEQIASLRLSDVMHSKDADSLVMTALERAQQQGTWSGESTIRDCDGNDVPVSHVIICHQTGCGKIQCFSSIMRDMSDRKAAETLLQERSDELTAALSQLKQTQAHIIQAEKMSSLGHMVAGIAHEINNPVNFIYGNLEPASIYAKELLSLINLYGKHYPNPVLEIKNATEAIDLEFIQQDLPILLNSMAIGTERIQEIVLSLRNFSRLDQADFKTVDIHEGIDSTLIILNHRLKADNAEQAIEVIKHYGDLPLVSCYPSQLNQVLMNILANAIDALALQPHPIITITTEAKGAFVTVRISDNGAGIPEKNQPYILDPFFTTKEVGKGTGMGMSISYQIVTEKHGGRLSFVSKVGQGTEFLVSIPIRQPQGK